MSDSIFPPPPPPTLEVRTRLPAPQFKEEEKNREREEKEEKKLLGSHVIGDLLKLFTQIVLCTSILDIFSHSVSLPSGAV